MTDLDTTLLIVDDEPDIRLLVRTLLQGSDYRCLEAGDGAEALELLTTREDIDMVLLDIRMPGVDGFGVLERLDALHLLEQYDVVAFSAHAEPAVIERVTGHGVKAIIQKPFTADQLTSVLDGTRTDGAA